jgi:hypothetical protein
VVEHDDALGPYLTSHFSFLLRWLNVYYYLPQESFQSFAPLLEQLHGEGCWSSVTVDTLEWSSQKHNQIESLLG